MNRHPIDRLADIREKIRALEAEADAIRADILAGKFDAGIEYQAAIREQSRVIVVDVRAALRVFGERLEPFLRRYRVPMVFLKRVK
jgi:hypothetical protein